jgi:hypothetical protein
MGRRIGEGEVVEEESALLLLVMPMSRLKGCQAFCSALAVLPPCERHKFVGATPFDRNESVTVLSIPCRTKSRATPTSLRLIDQLSVASARPSRLPPGSLAVTDVNSIQ